MKKHNIDPEQIRKILYSKSGIYGKTWINIFNHKHNIHDEYMGIPTSDTYIRYRINRTVVDLFNNIYEKI